MQCEEFNKNCNVQNSIKILFLQYARTPAVYQETRAHLVVASEADQCTYLFPWWYYCGWGTVLVEIPNTQTTLTLLRLPRPWPFLLLCFHGHNHNRNAWSNDELLLFLCSNFAKSTRWWGLYHFFQGRWNITYFISLWAYHWSRARAIFAFCSSFVSYCLWLRVRIFSDRR